VALALLPLLSRIYTPEDFGVLAIVTSLVLILGTVSTARLELAVPLPKADHDARTLARVALILAAGVASLATVVLLLAAPTLGEVLGVQQPTLLATAGLGAFFFAAFLVLNQLALRRSDYAAVGRRNIISGASTPVLQLTFAVLRGAAAAGLVWGYIGGVGLGALGLAFGRGAPRREPGRDPTHPGERWTSLVGRYRRFPILSTPSALLNIAGLQVPVLVVAYFYSAADAGAMGMAQRVLAAPVTLIGTALAQAYLSGLSRSVRERSGSPLRLFVWVSRVLVMASVVVAGIVLVLGPELFAVVLGPEWRVAGQFAQALSIGLAGQFVAAPMAQTLIVLERQGAQLLWDVARLVLVVGSMVVLAMMGKPVLTVLWAFSLSSGLCYVALWMLSWRAVRALRPTEA